MGGRASKEERVNAKPRMQPPLFGMSRTDGRQLQRRIDVRAETLLLAARPLLLWAFQANKKQLQAIFGQRSSLTHVAVLQRRGFGSFRGQTAAEFADLQQPVRDACREVYVFLKRVRRHASAEAKTF